MRKAVITAGILLLAAVTAQAAPIHPIGEASTVGFTNGAFNGLTPRGWDFMITQAITVEQLGVNAGVDIPITLTLWDVTTQTVLAQTSANSAAFSWVFADIAPILLSDLGHIYSVIGWADTTGSAPWYIFNNNPPPAFNPVGIVSYLNGRFDNGIGPNDFPQFILAAPAQYGVTDIGYEIAGVPEPATLALLGIGLAGLIGCSLKRKR